MLNKETLHYDSYYIPVYSYIPVIQVQSINTRKPVMFLEKKLYIQVVTDRLDDAHKVNAMSIQYACIHVELDF